MTETKEVQVGPRTYKIPESWNKTKVSELASVEYGKSLPEEDGKIPAVGSSGIFDRVGEVLVDHPTIVVGRKGTAGVAYLLHRDSYPSDTTFYLDEIDSEMIDLEYLHYHLRNRSLSKELEQTTLPSLKRERLETYKVLRPPLPEQRRIAEILSTVDEAIQQTDEIIETSKELKKGLMQDLLTKGISHDEFKEVQLGPKNVEIPKEWRVSTLVEESEIVSGSTPKKSNEDYWGGDITWITPTDITGNDGKFISDSEDKITEEGLDSCSTHILEPGAVLMTSRATIGEASINKVPACTNQGFKSIVCGKKLYNEFFYYFLPMIKDYLNAIGGGSTFPEINKTDVETIRIPVPPLDEQREIAERLSVVDEKIRQEEEYREKLEELKKGLMQDLLTGKTRVEISNRGEK